MKKLLLLLCAVFILTLCACGFNSDPTQIQGGQSRLLRGEVKDNTYINSVVGFSAALPEGWVAATPQEMGHVFGVSADYLNSATELSPDSQMLIFYCSEYTLGYVGQNSGIGIQVSNEDSMKSLLTSEDALDDYVERNRSGIKQQYADANAELSSEMNVKAGNNEYSVIHLNANFNGTQIIQDMYILGIGDYVLIITVSYSDSSDKAAADKFIESLKVE